MRTSVPLYNALCGANFECVRLSSVWNPALLLSLEMDTESHCVLYLTPSLFLHFASGMLVVRNKEARPCLATLWYAPAPNSILAVLKIVCISS